MKNLTAFAFFITLSLNALTPAWAEDSFTEASQPDLIQKVLEPAQVTQKEKLTITLKEGRTFSLDMIPDREEMKQGLGLNIPEKLRQQIIAKGGTIEDIDPLAAYDSMTEESKKRFLEMRTTLLIQVARSLNSVKFAFGTGSLVGDALSFVKTRTLQAVGKNAEEKSHLQQNFQERSNAAVSAFLKGIDYKLFAQAPLVVESNEYGVSLSAGLIAETGLLRNGGGGSEEMGISVAYNKTSRAFIFEIFHNSEKFQSTRAAVSVIGVVGKLAPSMGRRQGAETLTGSSFYPPAVPGFSTTSSDYFSAGASSSLGFPPPPLADLLTFTNKFERHTWIRVTASPITKGFVRLQFGDVRGSFVLIINRFVDVYRYIVDKVFHFQKRSCGKVFIYA